MTDGMYLVVDKAIIKKDGIISGISCYENLIIESETIIAFL